MRQSKSVATESGLSDSFPWQVDKTVWNAVEKGKRSDQELKNENQGEKMDDRQVESRLINKPEWQNLPLIHVPFLNLLTNSCNNSTISYLTTLSYSTKNKKKIYQA